ncbi:MAG TPA: glycosyl hydrolase [Terriglobia bacterium]|nr:glycosyl hydrolase [Terriglobia bacterium]
MNDPREKNKDENKPNRREFFVEVARVTGAAGLASSLPVQALAEASRAAASESEAAASRLSAELKQGWLDPARSYRPHARWAWPGSAVTPDGITWELEQMARQGQGGVEIQIPWRMYAQGNIPYLSDEWLEMVRHTLQEAERRDMEVAVTFGPGWSFGGFWVPPAERSKVLAQGSVDVEGPGTFRRELPEYKPATKPDSYNANFHSEAPDENQIVAVVAGRVAGGRLEADSLTDLTGNLSQGHLQWQIPEGQWRLMVFRLKYTGQECQTTDNFLRRQWVVDHFSKQAMRNYCDYLGGALNQAFGEQFGKTLDSFFCDSFEIEVLPETIHWSNAALEQFRAYKGYDLTRYLPALWWDIGELTPKIRYDVNDFLDWLGRNATFDTFIGWCGRHKAQARIQPHYRFTEELIRGAGMTPRPETEVTTRGFEVVTDPRKATAAGAHLYGRKILSAEAYTFIFMQRYHTALEDLKVATDAFLRDGVTQFYNIEYLYSPEMHVAPSRDLPWANRISHWNTWWKYYHHLAAYVSRCCFLLRQGEFAGDVLVYSPQSTVWTEKVLFGNERRIMPYGNLGKTLVANGYDFDPVNDDILQNHARAEKGHIRVRELAYRFLILPRTTAVPVETMEFIRQFVLGGGVVIALDERPSASVGLKDFTERDARVREISSELFGSDSKGKVHPGGGRTYYFADYKIPSYEATQKAFTPFPQPIGPTPPLAPPQRALLGALREHLKADFALEGNQQSNGLTFLHRRLGQDDIYFVTNLQPEASETSVTFRVPGKTPEQWDPMTGRISPVHVYQERAEGVEIPLRLAPYASTLFIFRSGKPSLHLSEANLEEVREIAGGQLQGIAAENGVAQVTVVENGRSRKVHATVSGLPEPLRVTGRWRMTLEGYRFQKVERQVSDLRSWTEDPRSRHFSGTGRYALDFDVPGRYVGADLETLLDLGTVGNVAEVTLNGKPVGVAWIKPYRLDITQALKSGSNHLEILVTNLLINYVSGMKELPGVPAELVPHYGPTVDIYSAGTNQWEHSEKDFHPLPPSGLIGPVRIIPRKKVTIRL